MGASTIQNNYLINMIVENKKLLKKRKERMISKIESDFNELFMKTSKSDKNIKDKLARHKKSMIENQKKIYNEALNKLNELYEQISGVKITLEES
jgi:archaellum component FlaC